MKNIEQCLFIESSNELPGDKQLKNYDRLYFGHETCEKMLPNIEELSDMYSYASRNAINLTLVTPIVSDKGLVRACSLIESWAQINPNAEVVANDIGVLQEVSEMNIVLILGRLFDRAKRDVRIQNRMSEIPRSALDVYSAPGDSSVFSKFGIKRRELDVLPYRQSYDFDEDGVVYSLYYPNAYMASSWYCPTAEAFNTKANSKEKCSKPCRNHVFKMNLSNCGQIYLQGNAKYMLVNEPDINDVDNQVNRFVKRILWNTN